VIALCGAVAAATIGATFGPSRRAVRIDPSAMMRGE
jgi:hypothetical protein